MAMTINTNVASLNAQRNLNTSQTSLTTSLQRLSSGLRVNSAKDDAAGLAIAQRMTTQINGVGQAARNANDGISLAQTAEGALTSVSDSLQRMRELAVQSANASNSASDRVALQQEVSQLVQQINSVATQTTFNGVKLLDGTFNSQVFQVGANAGETITVSSVSNAQASALGIGSTFSYSTSVSANTVTSGVLTSGGVNLNGQAAPSSLAGDGVSASTSYIGAANTAQVAITAGDLTINGVSIGAVAAGGSATAQGSNIATAINAITATTGVTATNAAGVLTLTSKDGNGINVGMSGTAALSNTGLVAGNYKVGSDSAIAKASAFNAVSGQTGVTATVTASTVSGAAIGAQAAVTGLGTNYVKINGVNLGAIAAGADNVSQANNVTAAINAASGKTGVTATFDTVSLKVTLTAADGRNIDVDVGAGTTANSLSIATGGAASFTTARGGIALASTGSGGITLGGADIAKVGLTAGNTAATATFGAGVSSIDITTATGAQNALATIDAALSSVNSSRAALGAYQNRFTSAISNLQVTSENLSAAKGRIMDTDFAAETANLSKSQILQQAGTAMLAQANSLPQQVLKLLQ